MGEFLKRKEKYGPQQHGTNLIKFIIIQIGFVNSSLIRSYVILEYLLQPQYIINFFTFITKYLTENYKKATGDTKF